MLGKKFIFSHINKDIQASAIKKALILLEKAKISYRVSGCAANGVPIAAEVKEKYFKEIFLDVGLCMGALGLNLNHINNINQLAVINNGGIFEQIVGQILRTINPFYIEPALYCWHREDPGSNAEIDYIIQYGDKIMPIEVKARSTGSLKSLHLFMKLKNLAIAVRVNSDIPNKSDVTINFNAEEVVKYKLLSVPFYLVGSIYKLLAQVSL